MWGRICWAFSLDLFGILLSLKHFGLSQILQVVKVEEQRMFLDIGASQASFCVLPWIRASNRIGLYKEMLGLPEPGTC